MWSDVDGWKIAEWVLAALGGVASLFALFLGWLGSYHVSRLDRTIARVDDIRESYVTREEFQQHLARTERLGEGRHTENVAWLRRIEDTLDHNATEAKTDRHQLSQAIHTIGLQVATLIGRSEGKEAGK